MRGQYFDGSQQQGFAPPVASLRYEPIPGTRIVGLGHKARHGKDSVARAIQCLAPADVRCFAFATTLYAYCRAIYGMTTKYPTLLQRVGVEQRAINPNIWIDCVYWAIRDNPAPLVLITDLRFQNEAAFVKAMGGLCVKIERREPGGAVYQSPDRDPAHISEVDLNDYAWDAIFPHTNTDEITQNAGYLYNYVRGAHVAAQ
jgi:hypothetical protein